MWNCGNKWQSTISSSGAVDEELTLEEQENFRWLLIENNRKGLQLLELLSLFSVPFILSEEDKMRNHLRIMLGTGHACEWRIKMIEEIPVVRAMVAAPQSKEFSNNLLSLWDK